MVYQAFSVLFSSERAYSSSSPVALQKLRKIRIMIRRKLMKKEKKQLRYPGLKAGSIYGTVIFFIIPLIDTLTSENPNFISSLLNTKHIFKTILGAFFFGVMIHIIVSLRIARANTLRKSNSNRVNVALPYSSTACGEFPSLLFDFH